MNDQETQYLKKVFEILHVQHRKGVLTEHDYYDKRFLIPHLEIALSFIEKSNSYTDYSIQGIVDLALLYKAIGYAKISTEYYHKIYSLVFNLEDKLAAEIYKGLGRAYQSTGDFEEAKKAFEKAYKIYFKLNAESTLEKASISNDMGMIFRDIGNELQNTSNSESMLYFSKALSYLKHSVEMSELISEKVNIIRYLTNLGEIYRKLGNLAEGKKNIEKALKIGGAVFLNQKHRLLASAFFNLGNVYMDENNFEQAKLYFEKAALISLDENVAGKYHPLSARHIDALGMAWRKLGNEKNACHYFNQAHQILKQSGLGQIQLKNLIEKHVNLCERINSARADLFYQF